MEYAIVQIAGKQYKAEVGKTLLVDKLDTTEKELTITDVLAYHGNDKVMVGTPVVAGASVAATVVGDHKDKKIRVLRFKAKSHYHKVTGHRQPKTRIAITAISVDGAKKEAKKASQEA